MVTKVQIETEELVHGSYRFLINPSWDQFKISFETHLYQRPEYMALSSGSQISFGIARSDQSVLLGFISFTLLNKKACSGVGKPFGSLDLNQSMDEEILYPFLLFVEQHLRAMGVQQVEMRLPAAVYQPLKIQLWQKVLASNGYRQMASVVNHHLSVDARPFEQGIHTMERRRLRKCFKAGFQVEVVDPDELEGIFHFIKACRKERGQSLSLSWSEMSAAAKALPQAYILFHATLKGVRTAASIAVRVNNRILYNFYPASALSHQSYSPQVILLSYMYQYARRNQYEILDLGTSVEAGAPKESLQNFKERVGGISSSKVRYGKSLL